MSSKPTFEGKISRLFDITTVIKKLCLKYAKFKEFKIIKTEIYSPGLGAARRTGTGHDSGPVRQGRTNL